VSLSSFVRVGPRYSCPLGSVRFGQFSIRSSLPTPFPLQPTLQNHAPIVQSFPEYASLSFSSRLSRSRLSCRGPPNAGLSSGRPFVHHIIAQRHRCILHSCPTHLVCVSLNKHTLANRCDTTQISGKSKVIITAYFPVSQRIYFSVSQLKNII
jgi:hypothetical protein